jgi:hypothetical protein
VPPGASAAAATRSTPAASAEAWPRDAEAGRERTSEKKEEEESEEELAAKSEGDSAVERVATAGAWPPLAFVRASTSLGKATAEVVRRRAVMPCGRSERERESKATEERRRE